MITNFFVEDQGDGWWDCPSPLRCTVLDGPSTCQRLSVIYPLSPNVGTYLLVRVEPSIVRGAVARPDDVSEEYSAGYEAIPPTSMAIVSFRDWPDWDITNLVRDFSVPVIPVAEGARNVGTAVPYASHGVKAAVYRGPRYG